MSQMPVFSLNSPRDFFTHVVEANFAELEAGPNVRRLLNCTIAAWHMQDWVLKHWLWDRDKPEHLERWESLVGSPFPGREKREDKFKEWIDSRCEALKHVREVANHTKHIKDTETQEFGWLVPTDEAHSDFKHVPIWDVTERQKIEDHPNMERVNVTEFYKPGQVGTALQTAIDFWRKFLLKHHDWT